MNYYAPHQPHPHHAPPVAPPVAPPMMPHGPPPVMGVTIITNTIPYVAPTINSLSDTTIKNLKVLEAADLECYKKRKEVELEVYKKQLEIEREHHKQMRVIETDHHEAVREREILFIEKLDKVSHNLSREYMHVKGLVG